MPPQTTFTFCIHSGVFGFFELILLAIPFIVSVLFSLIRQHRLNDITTVLFAFGFIANNKINTAIRILIADNRPFPNQCGDGFGWPAREPQQLLCYIMVNLVFVFMWSGRVGWMRGLVLTIVMIASPTAFVLLGYYTLGQVMIGALVGTVVGITIVLFIHYGISPYLPWFTNYWNRTCSRFYVIPSQLQLTHVYHYHPYFDCGVTGCTSNKTGTMCCIPSPLIHIYLHEALTHFIMYAVIHFIV